MLSLLTCSSSRRRSADDRRLLGRRRTRAGTLEPSSRPRSVPRRSCSARPLPRRVPVGRDRVQRSTASSCSPSTLRPTPSSAASSSTAARCSLSSVFTPLLAAWSIWVGIGISTASSDVRVAQQLSRTRQPPALALTSLIAFQGHQPHPSPSQSASPLALLAVDLAGWRIVATLFNRERLITGGTPHHSHRLTHRSRNPGE